jgi:hypothetical protein
MRVCLEALLGLRKQKSRSSGSEFTELPDDCRKT